MHTITLRAATPADAAALGALHVASWHETYTGVLPDAMLAGLSVEARTAMWSNVLGDPGASGDAVVGVAQAGDRIVGFGCCGRQRGEALAEAGFTGEINAVYVLRANQGRGVGRSLMAAMAQALARVGHTAASLWVLRENVAARAFYESLGGQVVGEQREELPEVTLVEVAYGWRDLSSLAG